MRRLYKPEQEKISQFNTFQIFEKLYGQDTGESTDELVMPDNRQSHTTLISWLLSILLIFLLAFSLHPLLSYFLKTPYPLIAIKDNTLAPILKTGDVIFSTGIINYQQIKPGDLVVFYKLKPGSQQKYFFVRQVKNVQGSQVVVSGLSGTTFEQKVGFEKIIGKMVGGQHVWYLPFLSELGLVWQKIN